MELTVLSENTQPYTELMPLAEGNIPVEQPIFVPAASAVEPVLIAFNDMGAGTPAQASTAPTDTSYHTVTAVR